MLLIARLRPTEASPLGFLALGSAGRLRVQPEACAARSLPAQVTLWAAPVGVERLSAALAAGRYRRRAGHRVGTVHEHAIQRCQNSALSPSRSCWK